MENIKSRIAEINEKLNVITHQQNCDLAIPSTYAYAPKAIERLLTEEKTLTEEKQNLEKKLKQKYTEKLIEYKNDKLYGQYYQAIVNTLAGIYKSDTQVYGIEDFVSIYTEVIELVEKTLKSNLPEIEVHSILASISKKYEYDKRYGSVVEMIYVINLFDSIEDKSQLMNKAFINCRLIFASERNPYFYRQNDIWKLIAARIPAQHTIHIEDLELEIKRQKEIVEKQNAIISKLKEEMELVMAGYIKTETGFKSYGSGKKILILRKLLSLPTLLEGQERAEFKKLCAYLTHADDSTLERLLSMNELNKMESQWDSVIQEFSILSK